MPRVLIGLFAFLIPAIDSAAQNQLVTQQNLIDAILGRRTFLPIELNALDLNRDNVVDIADLTFYDIVNSQLVPSASFQSSRSKVFESSTVVDIEVVLTKELEAAQEISFSLGGTATYGTKADGGDYTVAGYDPAKEMGVVSVPKGADSALIPVTIYDDSEFGEGGEYISLMLRGGSVQTYFLGARQQHILLLDDNDATWTVGLEMPASDGYESFKLEIIEEDGVFDGRVLSDTNLIPQPEPNDADARGEDGWDATFFAGTGTLRIEIGPLPVKKELSLFDVERTLSYVLDIGPGKGDYVYDTNREYSGIVTAILNPVESRLGSTAQRFIYLRTESIGILTMRRLPSDVPAEALVLTDEN